MATTRDIPALLAFARSINPGHMLMYSRSSVSEDGLRPVLVRAEPLRGLNATLKTKEEEKGLAVLQVVESAELAAGDDTLVLVGKVLVRNNLATPFACSGGNDFPSLHLDAVGKAQAAGHLRELAVRYAINLLSGSWGWRNALESDSVTVQVAWNSPAGRQSVSAVNLLLEGSDRFNPQSHPHCTQAIETLANVIERALTSSGRGVLLNVKAHFLMGEGARVYPSQEWASESMKKASKNEWSDDGKSSGVTRVLAKIRNKHGEPQAIINDRKAGNALRVVDTWYVDGVSQEPIAAEVFGANSHRGSALRSSKNSFFAMLRQILEDKDLSAEQAMYYLAVCIRGGVLGGKE